MSGARIKSRNLLMQVILFVVTFGIYAIYWYYSTLNEMHQANSSNSSAGLWTLLLFVPFGGIFSFWHHSSEFSRFTQSKYPAALMFLLWIFVGPVGWLLTQLELNKAASPA